MLMWSGRTWSKQKSAHLLHMWAMKPLSLITLIKSNSAFATPLWTLASNFQYGHLFFYSISCQNELSTMGPCVSKTKNFAFYSSSTFT
ncbi:hypothetical protein VIGAN_05214800 [Vigna angularis var. angularis]|uniref:Uncharacterized protein n=1 Tax=Vigna angularis var. angularis TaxID=157739 RepID=A0A0S3S6Y1_PHAAN|nr:hypothetical protein VIGAN_05214800 [Vigna angularis var. angularis]